MALCDLPNSMTDVTEGRIVMLSGYSMLYNNLYGLLVKVQEDHIRIPEFRDVSDKLVIQKVNEH